MKKREIFISYPATGGEDLAGRLADELNERGYDIYTDEDFKQPGELDSEILNLLAGRDVFLFLLSPGFMDGVGNEQDRVRQELALALKKGKKIIPVMMEGFEYPDSLPEEIEEIRNLETVTASLDNFDSMVKKIESLLGSEPGSSEEADEGLTRQNYIDFIASITMADYLRAKIAVQKNQGIPLSGGIFYLCYKILHNDDLDNQGRSVFENVMLSAEILYKIAEEKDNIDLCALMQSVSNTQYMEAVGDSKLYMLQEFGTLKGEFVEFLWQSMSQFQDDPKDQSYFEEMLKLLFNLLEIISDNTIVHF